ncbi:hypothetical protein PHYSODRAFT_411938, partial [Phytophthora sojae]
AEPTKIKRVSWTKDGKNGGPSSLDVLVTWVGSGESYQLWLDGRGKSDGKHRQALQEITSELENAGLTPRSDSSVKGKITSLEKQYAAATEWLKEKSIEPKDVLSGKAGSDVLEEILDKCPYYQKFMPVFGEVP